MTAADDLIWLWVDSCGAVGVLAVCRGARVLVEERFVGRTFSEKWMGSLRGMLAGQGVSVGELGFVGVMLGPGSFTGVRVGLAAAKGMCVAVGMGMVGLSRLAVLEASEDGMTAVIDGGREGMYVRRDGVEWMMAAADVETLTGVDVVTQDVRVREALAGCRVQVVEHVLEVSAGMAWGAWRRGEMVDLATVDANYVRGEKDLYRRGKR